MDSASVEEAVEEAAASASSLVEAVFGLSLPLVNWKPEPTPIMQQQQQQQQQQWV